MIEMELGIVINEMGLKGAQSHRTYERMVETWLDPNEPIPTLDECKAKWNEIYPDIELNMLWGEIRHIRNKYLQESDWTQLSDSPLTVEQKTQWQTYRQELRDVTNQPDPKNIIWPTKPL